MTLSDVHPFFFHPLDDFVMQKVGKGWLECVSRGQQHMVRSSLASLPAPPPTRSHLRFEKWLSGSLVIRNYISRFGSSSRRASIVRRERDESSISRALFMLKSERTREPHRNCWCSVGEGGGEVRQVPSFAVPYFAFQLLRQQRVHIRIPVKRRRIFYHFESIVSPFLCTYTRYP